MAKPAVRDEHPPALAVQLEILPKHKKTGENRALAADALFGQDIVVIEIFDDDAAIRQATRTITTSAAFVGRYSEMGKKRADVALHIICENDQPAHESRDAALWLLYYIDVEEETKHQRAQACYDAALTYRLQNA
jgi:hypothetical protein